MYIIVQCPGSANCNAHFYLKCPRYAFSTMDPTKWPFIPKFKIYSWLILLYSINFIKTMTPLYNLNDSGIHRYFQWEGLGIYGYKKNYNMYLYYKSKYYFNFINLYLYILTVYIYSKKYRCGLGVNSIGT